MEDIDGGLRPAVGGQSLDEDDDDEGGTCNAASCRIVITIMIIIAFKGAIQDLLQSPHSAANCLQHVHSSGPGAVVCKSRATHQAIITCKCHVTCHLV